MTPNYAGREGAPQRIILASTSPRRRQLLALLCDDFEVVPPRADEGTPRAPEDLLEIAIRKAESVRRAGEIVIGADTGVFLEGEYLGKPADLAQARRYLEALAGRWHQVLTGICVLGPAGRLGELVLTRVKFSPLTAEEIDWYLGSEDVLDKAGGYAIQGRAGAFVERIEGDFYNVMGLPLSTAYRLLRRQGWSPASRRATGPGSRVDRD